MIVLIWRCTLRLLDAPRSLKEKRGVVRPILERMRNAYGLSAAEVGEHDRLNLTELGFCTVGSDSKKLESLADKALEALEGHPGVEVVEQQRYLENY